MRRTHIMIPNELVDEIDELVGKRGRSAFITEAARTELDRRRLARALVESEGSWRDEDHPELAQGAANYISQQRSEGESSDGDRRGRFSA